MIESRRVRERRRLEIVSWALTGGILALMTGAFAAAGINPLSSMELAQMLQGSSGPEKAEGVAIAGKAAGQPARGCQAAPVGGGRAEPAAAPAAGGGEAEAAAAAPAQPAETILVLILDRGFMVVLWLLFARGLAGIYVLWTTRRANFFASESDRKKVEDVLAGLFMRVPTEVLRWGLWQEQRQSSNSLRELLAKKNHLAELLQHMGQGAFASELALARYFGGYVREIREAEFQKMQILTTASNVAPVVGFAGTALGMILAFGKIAAADVFDQNMIKNMSNDIFIALITTIMALLIKAVCLSIKAQMQANIMRYTSEIELIPKDVTRELHEQMLESTRDLPLQGTIGIRTG